MHRRLISPRSRVRHEAAMRRRRCLDVLAQLEIPEPFSVRDFCRSVETASGRSIALHAMPVGWAPAGLCGLLASTDTIDHIYFTEQRSIAAQSTTIVHELGHILMPDAQSVESPGGIELDLPDLDAAQVRTLRGRTGFERDIEQTVELFASIVLTRKGVRTPAVAEQPEQSLRLSEQFG